MVMAMQVIRTADSSEEELQRPMATALARKQDMRRIAWTALGLMLVSGWSATAQQPASLGRPVAAADSQKPIVRGVAGDTPTMTIPEPAYLQRPQPYITTYPPAGYQYYPPPPVAYAPGSPYYPPVTPHYAPGAPNYTPGTPYYSPPTGYGYDPAYQQNLAYASTVSSTSLKGDPVRRTSFSSRSRSISRSGESVTDGVNSCCDWIKGCLTADNRTLFESDHSLDQLATPVTNPFLLEDPRSLTELRPIFIWQTIPGSAAPLNGGNAYFYGLQGRLALTDWLSFTLNKLGGVSIDPENQALTETSGLAEIWLGPKFTFLRLPDSCTAAAFGLQFQIPAGPAKVFQDTGSLSVVPYLTIATTFLRSSYGQFQLYDTLGIALDTGSGRSDYFYNAFSLGYDIANIHKYYLMLDLNWFHYTSSGNSRPTNMEGRDYANVGATNVSGNDYLTIAPAFRWKVNECVQFGLATEFAITNPKDFQEFRLIFDMIFRY